MIAETEFNRIPEQVLERNYSILTTDEFRYYMRLKYMSDGSYRILRSLKETDFLLPL
jgi:hypothetical protein